MSSDKPIIRVYFEKGETVEDGGLDMTLDELGGILPAVGDCILFKGVLQGLDRSKPENREIWEVKKRVFNPRDLESYVALVVEVRRPNPDEEEFVA